MRSSQVSLWNQSLTTCIVIVSLAGVWLLASESGTFAQQEDAKPEDAKIVQPLAPSTYTISPNETARTSGLDLSLSQNDPARFGVWKSPTATGRGSGGRKYDIVPGKPDQSILVYRMESDEPGVRMPNLGRNISHPGSIELIREWIQSMPLETPKPGE